MLAIAKEAGVKFDIADINEISKKVKTYSQNIPITNNSSYGGYKQSRRG